MTAALTYTSFVYFENNFELDNERKFPVLSRLLRLHRMTIDWRFNDRGELPGSDRIAVLAIDDDAVNQEGRWPWPREKIAKLTEKAFELGAKIIAFDVVFPEPDPNAAIPALKRLRRELSSNSRLTNDVDELIEAELSRTDGDTAFARTIKKHAGRLVMGSYFDMGEAGLSFQDICLDVLYERSPEARYWQSETTPLEIHDESLAKIGVPVQLKERIGDYVTSLEISKATEWFTGRDTLLARITQSLGDLADFFPPETYPGLAVLWLNDDLESAQAALEEHPDIATPEGARLLFERLAAAFNTSEAASLATEVRAEGTRYCRRFMTGADELLDLDQFKKVWGDNSEAVENFIHLNYHALWKEIHPEQTADLNAWIERLRQSREPNGITALDRWWVNIPILAQATQRTGHFNSIPDHDASIRRHMLVVRKGNNYQPSLALQAFLLDQGYKAVVRLSPERTKGEIKGVKSFAIVDSNGETVMTVPTDERGHLMINYSGPRFMFPHVSAAEILNERPTMRIYRRAWNEKSGRWEVSTNTEVSKADFLKDKILVLGATAIGIYDLRVTPFEENYPGVETHANVLSNLLVEQARRSGGVNANGAGFLRAHPREAELTWVVLLGIGTALSALLSYFGSIAGLGITALFMGGVYAIDRFVFFKNGIVTTVVFPILEIGGLFLALTFYKYFTEERKKRELKGTFEKYVSPAIVAEVLKDPENIELGGKKMNLTVMFSDVRGFTTISEKLDPRELTNLLNSYLTPMTDLVFRNKGTLDKYMGDAIMAFWGAPIPFPDHAQHACRCALQMLEKLKELQADYRAKGLPEIDIGIGLNTGEMSVGNMGSETVRNYTVMGDAVNLGSRLEGINKEYGTRIIISEFTYEAIKDSFTAREVDWVRVKGKAQPVRIYELISEGPPPAEIDAALKHFAAGFALYHERKFKEAIERFQEALSHRPEDTPSKVYIKRCESYLEEPPPADWDGVYIMKSK